ncbi:hypothetical protein [Streptomyces natalensis]|uniref:Uncharacterized protein n=1 Tax=Streptomyces natalensis ATCC 27448 TaxID=1240678 RepID=A0A0D7CSG1_9ACTN|nr:hypothetical protein [Streptomyces natalensis]KIZ18337.1 hypothetical protein SNA_10055 [Streptomyces natalensis ATCC 27448]
MDAELVTLATAGATTLVQQMTTQGWETVRRRVAALLARRRGGADEEAAERELEDWRADLMAALEEGDEATRADATAHWRHQLRRLLRDDPEAAAELRALLGELPAVEVRNSISGGVQYGTVIQTGTISGGLTLGGSPDRPGPR